MVQSTQKPTDSLIAPKLKLTEHPSSICVVKNDI